LLVLLEILLPGLDVGFLTVFAAPAEKIVIDYTQLTNFCSRKIHPASSLKRPQQAAQGLAP
jgi:hypothetical protein